MIKNKRILIIGGTGALGKTLVKRYYDDNDIIVLSRDEHKHYYLQKEYPNVHSIIGDVNYDESVDILDIVSIIQIIINNENELNISIIGDVNFDENLNILDIVYLVNIILES